MAAPSPQSSCEVLPFADIVRAAPLAIAILKPDGQLLEANPACLDLLVTGGEVVAPPSHVQDWFSPWCRGKIRDAVASAAAGAPASFDGALGPGTAAPIAVRATVQRLPAADTDLLCCYLQVQDGEPPVAAAAAPTASRLRQLAAVSARLSRQTEPEGLLALVAEGAVELTGARAGLAAVPLLGVAQRPAAEVAAETTSEAEAQLLSPDRGDAYLRLLGEADAMRLDGGEVARTPLVAAGSGISAWPSIMVARLRVDAGGQDGILVAVAEAGREFAAEDEFLILQLARTASATLMHAVARQQLCDLSAQIDALFAVLSQPAAILGSDGAVLRANSCGLAVFGPASPLLATTEEISLGQVRNHDQSRVEPRSLPASRALRGEAVKDATYRVTRPGLGERLVAVSALPVVVGDVVRSAVVAAIDTTELAQAREAEQSVLLLPEENPSPVLRCDGDGALLFANRASRGLLEHWAISVGERLPEGVMPALMAACATGKPQLSDVTFGGKTLELQWVPVAKAGHVNVYGRDVSERVANARRLEALAHEAERRASELEATIASIASAVIIRDASGRIVRMNEPARSVFFPSTPPGGLPPSDWTDAVAVLRPDGSPYAPSELPTMRALAGEVVLSEMIIVRQASGAAHWMLTSTAPIRDSAGRLLGTVSTYSDVSELHEVQEKLREANRRLQDQAQALLAQREDLLRTGAALEVEHERLRVTLQSIGDGVIATDAQGRVVLMNGVAESLAGWTEAEARGLPLASVFHIVNERTGERATDPVRRVLETAGVVGLANYTELISRDGSRHSVADSGAPIRNSRGETIGVVIVFRDVTLQRELDEEMARANRLESLGLLAGGIAHDFNNLLTAIVGSISLARLDAEDNAAVVDLLAEAEAAALRAKDLTQQLLTFAKGGAPVPKEADLSRLVTEAARFVLRGSRAHLSLRIAENLWPVSVDEGQMAQVVQNLVINAVEAMPDGGTVEISVEDVALDEAATLPVPAGPYVRLAVADEGVGIAPDQLSRLFDPYYTTKPKGSGLGLAVCYSVVSKHGGCITVEPRPERGTVFSVYLPADRAMVGAGTPTERLTAPLGRVLVMDDEEVVRSVAERMLAKLGYDVEAASDGAEAVAAYAAAMERGEPFDVVVLDLLVLSGVSGREALQQLRELDPDVRAIVASGYHGGPFVTRYADYGFAAAVSKPFDMQALATTLQEVMGR